MKNSATQVGAILVALSLLFLPVTDAQAQDSVYDANTFQLGDGQPPPGMPGMANILEDSGLSGPDWATLFAADGSPRDDYPLDANGNPAGNGIPDYQELYGGQWVVFTADDVSLGTGLETTALAPDGRVRNGVVGADHDIGNAYVYSTTSSTGNLIVYVGLERLGTGASYFEFEFNQDLFRLGHGGYGRGEPWQVDGERIVGDVLVKMTFEPGSLGTVETSAWDGQGWVGLSSFTGQGCDQGETLCAVCNATVIDGGPWVNYDTDGDPEQIAADRFIEAGINVGALLGSQPSYTTVRLRTPGDAAFGYFEQGN